MLLGFLTFGSAAAQEIEVLDESMLATEPSNSNSRPAQIVRLNGVLISEFSRSALLNGRPIEEGDRVDGAEIIAIEQHGIRVLVGGQELSIDVGNTFVTGQSSTDVARVSRKPTRQSRNQERLTASHLAPSRDNGSPPIDAQRQHAVEFGETLSGIAYRYRKSGVTMDQMMIALYQSNPHAFSGNINVLHEGTILRIPDENELSRRTRATAAAEVARHTDSWQVASLQSVSIIDSSRSEQYGPVESGETLSAIASRLVRDGISTEQMMIALYRSNPQAFSSNINVLHAGAVLRIPDERELNRQTPETATAEVLRQTKVWRARFEQHALAAMNHTNIMASADGLIDK